MRGRAKVVPTILILIAFSFCLHCTRGNSGYADVTTSEAKNMIDSNPSLLVLDVRTQSEYNSGHIRNAKLISHTELEARINELDENRETLVYCRSGYRSETASQILIDHGFTQVYNMLGGILAWTSADYPVFVRYSSIQAVIDEASGGDTIFVASGIYYENLAVSKSLTLVGENRDTTLLDGGGAGTVVAVMGNNTGISDFTIRGSGGGCPCFGFSGVLFANSHNSNVTGSIIRNNGYGINLVNSIGCTVSDNIVTNNEWGGIRLDSSRNSSLTGNTIKDNEGFGIELLDSSGCTVDCNKITNSTSNGIYLYNSDSCTVSNTEVTNNDGSGIWLQDSDSCTVAFNMVAHNFFGISVWGSDGNSIYHNNFLSNIQQTSLNTAGFNNSWDNGYPSGGNYWSDYEGVDEFSGLDQDELGSDGIGDAPYVVGLNNQDRYPLMNPYIPPEELRVLYYELLEKYNNLLADYQSLNSTYYELLHSYSHLLTDFDDLNATYYGLLADYGNLNSTYHTLLSSYTELQGYYDALNMTYYDVLTNYNSLNSSYSNIQANYNSLNSTYNELKSKLEATVNELNNIRNLMYIFIATTTILTATTVYFTRRKLKS